MARSDTAAARVVEYWRAVEMFSPPPGRGEPSWDGKLFRLTPEEVPPWDPRHALARIRCEPGKVWQHTVYGGVFQLERLRDVIVAKFGENEAYRDGRLSGWSAVFALSLSSSGTVIKNSGVLSACAWAVGRTLGAGPGRPDWLSAGAWETDQENFALHVGTLGEPAVPTPETVAGEDAGADCPDDQEIPERRAPVTVEELSGLLRAQTCSLGVEALAPDEVWVRSIQVRPDPEESADNDFLNSFILSDLQRARSALAQGSGGTALDAFLRPRHSIDAGARVDVLRSPDAVLTGTNPNRTPPGRWVAKPEHALALSQQFAVNQLQNPNSAAGVPVFAVNGPPGTGKTTMLRDVIAALVVERADRLSNLATPEAAFAGSKQSWSTEAWRRHVRPLRPELTGFEIVVACAGNGAAKNITHEFPGPDGIDGPWREEAAELDYFAQAASIVLELEEADPDQRAWAAIAGALGKMSLRRTFSERFWWGVTAKEQAAAAREKRKPNPSGHGLASLLSEQSKNGAPIDWKAAVARFAAAKFAVDALTEQRQAASESAGAILAERACVEQATTTLARLDEQLASAEAKRAQHSSEKQTANTADTRARQERAEHAQAQPGLFVTVSTWGRAGREWHERDKQLAAAVTAAAQVLTDAERDERDATGHRNALTAETAATRKLLTQAEQRLRAAEKTWASALTQWPENVPSPAVLNDEASREKLSPWNDPEISSARTRLFLEALRLHKQFLLATSRTMRQNLQAAFDLITGNAPADITPETAKAAWQSLFLAVPVVSTTFASMGRLFSHLGREDLGWVLIDEAGQAAPQNAVGALWRAKQAVIVGDPLQLEPVITVPHTLQQALREHFGVEEEWLPGWSSVQAVADRLAPHGTYLERPSPDGESNQIWVGAPLRVHRRCDEPMFTISNDVAYGGTLMVNGKHTIPKDSDPYLHLPSSRWVHVRGAESDKAWIPAEGERLKEFVRHLLTAGGVEASRIRVISPFRDVVDAVKDLKFGLPGDDPVGTIHTMQGKEADIVFLVLGGARHGQRAWAAEKPNLLNVAVSRAKRRLYVIGDHDRWMRLPHFNLLAAHLPQVTDDSGR